MTWTPAWPASPLDIRVVAVERSGDPHGGSPAIEGVRCEGRRHRWRCVRYVASAPVLPGSPGRRPKVAWAKVPEKAAMDLLAIIAAEDAIHLEDTSDTGIHAVTTTVYLETPKTTHRFQLAVTLGGPLPDRAQDRVAAAIWSAALASGAPAQTLH